MPPAEPLLLDTEPDEICTPPDAAPSALATRTSPLLLKPFPLRNATDAPMPDALAPPDTFTSPPVTPAPPAKVNEPPKSPELLPPDTLIEPPTPAASPPDMLTDPLDCASDAPEPIEMAPDEPISTEPLDSATAPLFTELTPP
ncbi:uncharacterized protein PITG_01492 [Phytophthora infestans T30-4]|uniref:Uncharacterized protein n=1 Tax=Phytophthora infestans (strain T30-4) TaxID=403677 RepID=D0MTD9_PHYIT|nr:uncharacterized protein PITG_01492 [Phytophthora infestans T30-4]EEY61236.1 conserved hypothetical protein [Phytophthora infestans T30-4]|eukprot:XP_002908153.1 conserved hypothetical protein [Phytophthora infestans T30-4]